MRHILFIMAFFTLFAAIPSVVFAEDPAQDPIHDIKGKEAYSYATSESQANGAVFMKVDNTLPMPVKLIGASSDVAESVELHSHVMDGSVVKMREADSFNIPGGSALALFPSGPHIMLMGLKEPLESGSSFTLTLHFENQDDVDVTVEVQ